MPLELLSHPDTVICVITMGTYRGSFCWDSLHCWPRTKSRACKATTCLASFITVALDNDTQTTTAPSLRAHVTKKDKTVVEGKAAFSSKARVPGLRAAVEAEGKEPSEGREAHNPVRVRN
jgi:hypothetical protein